VTEAVTDITAACINYDLDVSLPVHEPGDDPRIYVKFRPTDRPIISTRIATAIMIQITIMIFFCKPTYANITHHLHSSKDARGISSTDVTDQSSTISK